MSTTLLATAACVLGLLGAVTGVLALRTLAKLRSSVRVLNRALGRDSFVEVQAHHLQLASDAAAGVTELRAQMNSELASVQARLGAAVDALRAEHSTALDELRNEQHRVGPAEDATSASTAEHEALQTARAELAAGIRAAFEQLEQTRARLLDEVAAQRELLHTDQNAAQDLMRAAVADFTGVVNSSLRRVALIRFDAFDGLSGRLSFCLALLDGHGDGIALTSLASSGDTRLYARPITGGASEIELMPEEKQAVRAALKI